MFLQPLHTHTQLHLHACSVLWGLFCSQSGLRHDRLSQFLYLPGKQVLGRSALITITVDFTNITTFAFSYASKLPSFPLNNSASADRLLYPAYPISWTCSLTITWRIPMNYFLYHCNRSPYQMQLWQSVIWRNYGVTCIMIINQNLHCSFITTM